MKGREEHGGPTPHISSLKNTASPLCFLSTQLASLRPGKSSFQQKGLPVGSFNSKLHCWHLLVNKHCYLICNTRAQGSTQHGGPQNGSFVALLLDCTLSVTTLTLGT